MQFVLCVGNQSAIGTIRLTSIFGSLSRINSKKHWKIFLKNEYFRKMDKTENQINIELSEELAEGVYSNLAIITHSQAEFVTDFIQMMPGMPKAKVRARVIMSPQNAKRLMRALAENIQKYEQTNGVIAENDTPPFPPMNFGGPATQA